MRRQTSRSWWPTSWSLGWSLTRCAHLCILQSDKKWLGRRATHDANQVGIITPYEGQRVTFWDSEDTKHLWPWSQLGRQSFQARPRYSHLPNKSNNDFQNKMKQQGQACSSWPKNPIPGKMHALWSVHFFKFTYGTVLHRGYWKRGKNKNRARRRMFRESQERIC